MAMKGSRHTVARAADLPPGSRIIVTIAGREIGIFNIEGSYYAIRNQCPHRFAPLCLGRTGPRVSSPGVYQVAHEPEGHVLKCPWHLWEFDRTTGRAICDPKLRVRTYPVECVDDELVIVL